MRDKLLKKYEKIKKRKFIISVCIDSIGLLSLLIPGIGESIDLIWAPISAFLIYILFPEYKKYAFLGFLEEVIPVTDFIPTAYLAWRQCYVKDRETSFKNFLKKELEKEEIINKALD